MFIKAALILLKLVLLAKLNTKMGNQKIRGKLKPIPIITESGRIACTCLRQPSSTYKS